MLFIRSRSSVIDCQEGGSVCISTRFIDQDVELIIQDEIKVIIVTEKRGMLDNLCQAKLWESLPCIIVASGGRPDATVRRFVRKLADLTTVPVVAFTDWDPSGLVICNAYRFGTIECAYECTHLTTSRMKWLGMRHKHIVEYVVRILTAAHFVLKIQIIISFRRNQTVCPISPLVMQVSQLCNHATIVSHINSQNDLSKMQKFNGKRMDTAE
jgi:DNA topoisomerase VI subunit A